MGVARLLGFDRRLHVPQHHRVPAELLPAADCDVRLDLIESVWDELVRVSASIQSGQCSAVQALTRFGAAARGQPVYDGGVQLGRLFRTIFLIDYFTNPVFRAELQHALNRGEAVHTVQRAIHVGKIPSELAKHHDSLAAVSSALTLLSNAVMAWNTMHMQRAVDEIEARSGQAVDIAGLRHIIAPTHLDGINLRGTFDFPLAPYAHRVLPSSTPDPTIISPVFGMTPFDDGFDGGQGAQTGSD
jgi:hypothetical protein